VLRMRLLYDVNFSKRQSSSPVDDTGADKNLPESYTAFLVKLKPNPTKKETSTRTNSSEIQSSLQPAVIDLSALPTAVLKLYYDSSVTNNTEIVDAEPDEIVRTWTP